VSVLIVATFLCQFTTAQLQLSDPDEQSLLVSVEPAYKIRSVKLKNGIRLEFAEQGASSGIPVIFLHGYTDSWYSFEQTLHLLPESIHAYVISQRGHGNSDRPEGNYTTDAFSSDLALFLQEMNIPQAIIVGHSMGATIAQRFVLNHPELTKAIVLVGSLASFSDHADLQELKATIYKIEDPIDYNFVYEFQKSTLYDTAATSIGLYVKESMKVPARVWKLIARQLMHGHYLDELMNTEIPALIMWGDKDIFCCREDQDILLNAINGSILNIFEGVRHAIHREAPERFVTDLVQFIQNVEENSLSIYGACF
jgi:pimeloyl-ACP methyl ester carboxylesterase